MNTVARYNLQVKWWINILIDFALLQGFVETLPSLSQARHSHGCGSYTDQSNAKVSVVSFFI
jgi:hypothetical protein